MSVQLKDRLTVVENIYHQISGEQPTMIPVVFDRNLETSEQPFKRTTTVGEEWQLLELGWFKESGPGTIVVLNLNPRFDEVEILQSNGKMGIVATPSTSLLEIGIGNTEARECGFLIFPQEAFRGTVKPGFTLFIRSTHGKVKFTVHVLPR